MHDLTAVPWWRRWLRRFVLTLVGSLLVIGPWPVDDSSFQGSAYQVRTLDRLDSLKVADTPGPIRVGVAEVDLTPTSPRPLAGFIGQTRTPFVGVDSPCLARALTIERGPETVTILTADLLLINAKLARTVVERAGLQADQVYFTSSHTHGGPGGWGDHPIEMLVAGAYDAAYFATLTEQLAQVVKQSRARLEPAEMAFARVQTHDRQRNRVDPTMPTHDALSALVFRPRGAAAEVPPLALLVVFGAHATVSHPVPPRLGGDYPSALVEELKRQTGAKSVLFASGAVGDASPARPKAPSQFKSAQALGTALAGDLIPALRASVFEPEPIVSNLRLDVDLPPMRLPFFAAKLRFSPALTWWIADRRTHLHALRIGPAVLVGFPGDYSGHLALKLEQSTLDPELSIIPTSFDGDFRGYLVSARIFQDKSCYETRWMSFYGPVTGDYFNDLAGRMVHHLSDHPTPSARVGPDRDDLSNRIGMAALLSVAGAVGWRRRREWLARARTMGWLTVGLIAIASLGFLVAPDLFAWAKFGCPWWVRMLGLPIGLAGLYRANRARSGWYCLVGCGLLAASWLIVLMSLRVWVKNDFRIES